VNLGFAFFVPLGMASTKLQFINSEGLTLTGKIDMPADGKPGAYAVFAHCFTCNKNLTAVRTISRALNQEGIAVLRFDFAGLGESEGEFADTNFSSNVSDLVAASEALAKDYDSPKLLIGHSLGGAAVLFAGGEIDSVQAVVTIGAPSDPKHVVNLFSDGLDAIDEKGEAEVNIGGRPFKVKSQFIEDLKNRNPKEVVKSLRKPLLVMHSPQDSTVEIKNAAEIYSAAHHPKSFISLDGADHLLSNKADSTYVGKVIAGWADRYIDRKEIEDLETDHAVLIRTGEKFTTDIKAGHHSLLADEPKSVGGDDLGPNPYDFLLSGLGACTGMTLRMYANRKKWDLQEVKVHLDHGRNHIEDCEGGTKKIQVIDKVIELSGDLDDTQRARLLEIADRCPVHRTLNGELKIRSKLV
jgi:uncharacterized OsmC-like protein/fermentation-respiration switch protein FrsA (DUF1100 family)